jgi:Spx/MgsR family transcriptional regulator
MIVLHGLTSCDACRRARRTLAEQGTPFAFRDLRADPPSRDEVLAWHAAVGDALLNRRSTTWRGLPEVERAGDPADLMTRHPTLIKRPVVVRDGAVSIGL